MNEMQMLERMWADSEADPSSLRRARRRLLRHALAPKSGQKLRVRRFAVGAGIAATVALGLLLTDGIRGPVGTTAAAAAVLDRAADASRGDLAGPNQWTHIRHETTRPEEGSPTVSEAWIPGSPAGEFRRLDPDGRLHTEVSEVPAIAGDPGAGVDELHAWLSRDLGDLSGAAAAFERAGETLAATTTPPAFRARLFAAIKKIEGVRIADESTEFAGQDAVVLGRDDQGYETQLAFAKDSGEFIGFQGVGHGTGMASYQTAVTTQIVDSLPQRAQDQR